MSQLAELALKMIIEENGKFRLQDDAEKGLAEAVQTVVREERFDAKVELEGLIRLGLLFERKYHTVVVFDAVAEVIASDGAALAAIGVSEGTAKRALEARFARFEGERSKGSAPVYGTAAPKGTVKLSSFLTPNRRAGGRPGLS